MFQPLCCHGESTVGSPRLPVPVPFLGRLGRSVYVAQRWNSPLWRGSGSSSRSGQSFCNRPQLFQQLLVKRSCEMSESRLPCPPALHVYRSVAACKEAPACAFARAREQPASRVPLPCRDSKTGLAQNVAGKQVAGSATLSCRPLGLCLSREQGRLVARHLQYTGC